jgi:uroporphyrinogen III methyltransferase/synthase
LAAPESLQKVEAAHGHVYLVGAGPGDPGLLTARALELIATAEVILHDRLIPGAALDGARPNAELLFVGKEGGGASVPQERTESLMIERARAGKRVVRLKGGDPFVFGRGGEEALALRAAGVPFEVVPGVTAGVAASAYAGIPVTHRGLSSAVALVTGHEDPGKDETAIDWQALAAFPGTLVFYMGVQRLPQIAESLIAAGRPAAEPAAVVEAGTLPTQRTVTSTLEGISAAARAEDVRPPSIAVVGAVAALAEELSWLPARPLAGRTVAVTRARAQASALASRLQAHGARVLQAPAIRVQPLAGTPLDPSPYDLVCLTSPNGVETLFDRLRAAGRDARSLAGARVAAIGPGTARALAEHGVLADVVPDRFVAEALVEALAGAPVSRALVARARGARDVLPDGLRAAGAEVDVLDLYETVAEPIAPQALQSALHADYITFTSSSTVRFFLEAAAASAGAGAGEEDAAAQPSPSTRIVSIGPVTSQTLREHGLEPHVEAPRHDIDGVVEALLADAAAAGAVGT